MDIANILINVILIVLVLIFALAFVAPWLEALFHALRPVSRAAGGQCSCFEWAGDNERCPVHGKAVR